MITDALLAATTMRGPPECQPHHSTIETSIALFLCFGLVVSYLPQIVRIILKRSSLGFSPWFLFLGATSSASSFLNVVSLQWSIISCCKWMVSRDSVERDVRTLTFLRSPREHVQNRSSGLSRLAFSGFSSL